MSSCLSHSKATWLGQCVHYIYTVGYIILTEAELLAATCSNWFERQRYYASVQCDTSCSQVFKSSLGWNWNRVCPNDGLWEVHIFSEVQWTTWERLTSLWSAARTSYYMQPELSSNLSWQACCSHLWSDEWLSFLLKASKTAQIVLYRYTSSFLP
jgi:hypothetical protein